MAESNRPASETESQQDASRTASPPRSLYVHIPFCRHRCGYCNFALVAGRDGWIERYRKAIEIELRFRAASYSSPPPELATLYLGGGTPTHLPSRQLERLLRAIAGCFPISDETEVTVEANPIDITDSLLNTLTACGVNRISLGGQSFSDRKLKALDRDHDAKAVEAAVAAIQRGPFRLAMDLIFAAPDETEEEWAADLERTRELNIPHVSTYGLTIEKGTRFWSERAKGDLQELEELPFTRMYRMAIDRLSEAGLTHYEISNFSKPNQRSRHNQIYWSGQPYEAIGCGASRFIGGVRQTNHRSPARYMQMIEAGQNATAENDELPPRQRALEMLVIGMRQIDGVHEADFHSLTRYAPNDLAGETIDALIVQDYLVRRAGHLKLSSKGLPVSDAIWERLLRHLDDGTD